MFCLKRKANYINIAKLKKQQKTTKKQKKKNNKKKKNKNKKKKKTTTKKKQKKKKLKNVEITENVSKIQINYNFRNIKLFINNYTVNSEK